MDDYQKFINEQLSKEKFTRKGESVAREAANNWIQLFNSGNFDKIYSYNPTTQKYNINTQDLPENLKSIDWSGSPEAIHSNILGRMSAKEQAAKTPQQKYNTLLANWTSQYLANKQNTPTQKIQVQRDFAKDFSNSFGGGDDSGEMWDKYKKDVLKNDPEAIKKYVMETYKNSILNYGKTPNDKLSYTPIENRDALLEAASKGNWDYLVNEEFKHGIDLNELLTVNKEQTTPEGERTGQTDPDAAYRDQLRKMRFDEDTINKIIAGKFKIDPNYNIYGAENTPWLKNRLESMKATVFTDPYNRQLVFKDGQPYAPIFNDPYGKNSEGYGTYIGYDKSGYARYYNKNTEGYNPELFQDTVGGKDLRPIEGTVTDANGNQIGSSIQGFSPQGGDYTGHLVVTKPDGSYIELLRDNDGNYKDNTGNTYNVDITSYGQYNPNGSTLPYFDVMNNPKLADFRNIPASNTDVNIDFNKLPQISDWNDWASQYRNMFANLNYKLQNETYFSQLNQTAETYSKLLKALDNLNSGDLQKILSGQTVSTPSKKTTTGNGKYAVTPEWINAAKARAGVYKEGGILIPKYQQGQSLKRITPQEYLTKYTTQKPDTNVPDTTPKIEDIRHTMKDMAPEDYISLAGAAASMIPGVGLIGGAVSTLADIEKDIRKDGFQWSDIFNWNTAANLGFTALGAFGLGGLKGLKIAKELGAAGKIAKEANAAKIVIEGVEDTSKLAPEVVTGLGKIMNGEAKTFASAGIKKEGLEQLKSLNIPELQKIKSTTSVIPKTFLGKLSEVVPTASPLSQEFSGTINAFNKIKGAKALEGLPGKIAKSIQIGGMAATIPSAINVVHTAATKGVDNVDPEDLKNSLFLLSAARGYLKTAQLKNAAKGLLKASPEATPLLRSGETEIKLPQGTDLEMPKFKTEKIFKKSNAEANAKILQDFKDKIKGLGVETIPDNFNFKKAKFITPEKSMFKTLKESKLPENVYNRTLKAATGEINYWQPSWLNYHKNGGVLKFQTGGSTAVNTGSGLNLAKIGKFLQNGMNEDVLNSIGLGLTFKGNQDIARLQKRAALADLVNISAPSKINLRTGPSVLPFYETQANKITSAGNRLSSSISDFDKRAGVMLAANKQANDLLEKGRLTDAQSQAAIMDKQAQIDAQDSAVRTDIMNRKAMNVGQVQKNINLIDANKKLANNTALQNFMLQFNRNRLISQQQQKYKDYLDLMNSPEYEDLTNQYNSISKEAEQSKKDWDTAAQNNKVVGTWEDTMGKTYTTKLKGVQDSINNYYKKINAARTSLQMPFLSKGGSLEDKKELLRYKQELKLSSDANKEVFKQILNNNQIMLKSLIKVFK